MSAGYRQLALGDFRLSPAHPPLAPSLAALGLLGLHPRVPPLERGEPILEWCRQFVLVQNDAGPLLARARVPVAILTLLLALLLWGWARALAGPQAGLAALVPRRLPPLARGARPPRDDRRAGHGLHRARGLGLLVLAARSRPRPGAARGRGPRPRRGDAGHVLRRRPGGARGPARGVARPRPPAGPRTLEPRAAAGGRARGARRPLGRLRPARHAVARGPDAPAARRRRRGRTSRRGRRHARGAGRIHRRPALPARARPGGPRRLPARRAPTNGLVELRARGARRQEHAGLPARPRRRGLGDRARRARPRDLRCARPSGSRSVSP